ncbi:hypothetical protein BKA65DRAFT_527665 [Rhexocercosporidium sp. MPI-PUGE-AT-0058]|nr:hypothetical protein BKA65DRAFT_527665 [Rhexocercosporidium sp. MPI-PUGE-AT-0058]
MEIDDAFVATGISALIKHPTEGLILFETGSGENWPTGWEPPYNDLFTQIDYTEDNELPTAIAKTVHSSKYIKAVSLGHLHLDHAGGLEHFVGTDIPIYTFNIKSLEVFSGLTVCHAQGHTPGFCLMQVNLRERDLDLLHFRSVSSKRELREGSSARYAHRSLLLGMGTADSIKASRLEIRMIGYIQTMLERTDAKFVFGHDKETFSYKHAPEFSM